MQCWRSVVFVGCFTSLSVDRRHTTQRRQLGRSPSYCNLSAITTVHATVHQSLTRLVRVPKRSEVPAACTSIIADRARQVSGWMSTIAALDSSIQQLWSKYAYAVAVALGSNLQERASQKVGMWHR